MQKSFPREKQCRERGAMGALPVATELPPAFQATPLASAGGKETECINAFPRVSKKPPTVKMQLIYIKLHRSLLLEEKVAKISDF